MRVYEGASPGRRATSWRSRGSSANAEIQVALRRLRERTRDLVRNTPHAPRMLDVLCTQIIGEGLRPVSSTGNDELDDKVDCLWDEWQAQADVEGIDSFYSMQVLAIRAMIADG